MRLPFAPTAKDLAKSAAVDEARARQADELVAAATREAATARVQARIDAENNRAKPWTGEDFQ